MKHLSSERHTLSILVDSEAGVLARIVGVFSARGYFGDAAGCNAPGPGNMRGLS